MTEHLKVQSFNGVEGLQCILRRAKDCVIEHWRVHSLNRVERLGLSVKEVEDCVVKVQSLNWLDD
jgi:hypothetical protein